MRKQHRTIEMAARIAAVLMGLVLVTISHTQAEPIKYLVIYHSSLQGSALSDFLSIQQGRGFSTVSYAIGDGVTRDSVKSLIQSVYDGGLLRYVLLVGAARSNTDTLAEKSANVALGNLIPTYFGFDSFGHYTAFDYRYAVLDEISVISPYAAAWPNVALGRLPVVDTADLRVYVDKLDYYLNDQSSQDWKNDILAICGDMDRGGFQNHVPPAQMILNQMEVISDSIPTDFDRAFVKYTDYTNGADRQNAVIELLDSGMVLVYAMATGSHSLNLSDMLHRGSGDGFDAAQDLAATNRYTIVLAASCNLGQSDYVYEGQTRLFPENFLFAPDRGAIAYIGPTGFSNQDENVHFLTAFSEAFYAHSRLSLGECFVAAQRSSKMSPVGDQMTLMMYTFYGDPSLHVNTVARPADTQLMFDFEYGRPLPLENQVLVPCSQVHDSLCCITTTGGYEGANRVYEVIGVDSESTTGPVYKSWLLYDDMNLTLSESTRFLQYHIDAMDHPEEIARFSVNCILSDSTLLSDICSPMCPADQFGHRLSAAWRQDSTSPGKWYVFDLSQLYGRTIDKLVIEYAAAYPSSTGRFHFMVDDIEFSDEWGGEPMVGEINAPSTMCTGSSATVSVNANDYDDCVGDSLSFSWHASAGAFYGTGPSVTYEAPSTAQTVPIFVTVSDLGNHAIMKYDTIIVTVCTDTGCPFLYVLSDGSYKLEDVLLTESEDADRDKQIVTDYYLLGNVPDVDLKGRMRLRLAEKEQEISHIRQVELYQYDISSLDKRELLALDDKGDLVACSDPVSPLFAEDDEGFDAAEKVRAEDGECFVSYRPGGLKLGYDLRHLRAGGTAKSVSNQIDGGIIVRPPRKRNDDPGEIRKSSEIARVANILTVKFDDVGVAAVYPRLGASSPRLVRLGSRVTDENDGWFTFSIDWSAGYAADALSFYRCRTLPTKNVLPLAAAKANGTNDVTNVLSGTVAKFVDMAPGQYIDMDFAGHSPSNQSDVRYVLKVVGYYEVATKPAGAASDLITACQNYPNPFNPTTTIAFELSEASDVSVVVFNALGQKVKTILSEYVGAGKHQVQWNGVTDAGEEVASGVYFYRIVAGDAAVTKKMVIVR